MAFVLRPSTSVGREIRRVARERIDDALTRLAGLEGSGAAEIEDAVHETRKRCKELRGLARLVRPALGSDFARFNSLVRDAAAELSSIRDAHAVLGTFDHLRAATHGHEDRDLESVREHQAHLADDATRTVQGGDPRIASARRRLIEARRGVSDWKLSGGFDPIAAGLGETYRRSRSELATARSANDDLHVHEWRKSVKYLWYQMRLLQRTAPSVLDPLIDQLDRLSEALGDDHDLAVLVERLDEHPDDFGTPQAVDHTRALARSQQQELRARAFRLGGTVFAERPKAFVRRMAVYWETAVELGPERLTGGIEAIAEDEEEQEKAEVERRRRRSTVERERTFLVAEPPSLDEPGTVFRQGYLALDHPVSVRVRDAGADGCTLTLKAGTGAVRTEFEWPLEPDEFEQLWKHTVGRRLAKCRHRIDGGDHLIELDVFGDALEGLVMAEVEFDDDHALEQFRPPPWFGREVTDDDRYTNASLAANGLDPSLFR